MLKWLRRSPSKDNNEESLPADHLIELRQVRKAYRTPAGEFVALDDVDFNVGQGEFVAVMGKSGSGKSTLINMISGIDRPTTGHIGVDGANLNDLDEGAVAEWRGRHVGLIFQFFQLLPTLTVDENIMVAMDFANVIPRGERNDRAIKLLERVGLDQHAGKLPSALSGGEQQRVAIARALANDPPVLLADEPTGNLDTKTADEVMELFDEMARAGKTLVMVTHDNDLAVRAGRLVTLADGRILSDELQNHRVPPAQETAP